MPSGRTMAERYLTILFRRLLTALIILGVGSAGGAAAPARGSDSAAAAAIGARLFLETRFSHAAGPARQSTTGGDRGKSGAAEDRAVDPGQAPTVVSCASCHRSDSPADRTATLANPGEATPGLPSLDRVPRREDGRRFTRRNSPALVDVGEPPADGLLHFDGEFSDLGTLIEETFYGRNFGWLPQERPVAEAQLAATVRADQGPGEDSGAPGGWDYRTLFAGTDERLPAEWRLAPDERLDVTRATDARIGKAVARLVAAYLRTRRFLRDAGGEFVGSPYDAFLQANRLPRRNQDGETPALYARRLAEAVHAMRYPKLIEDPARPGPGAAAAHFREQELAGLKIFLKSAVGSKQNGGAGNCADCHTPPQFKDGAFHNTGVTQRDYDRTHGQGAFVRLELPAGWPSAARRVFAGGGPEEREWENIDLGLWEIYAAPQHPAPQQALAALLDPTHTHPAGARLARTVAAFKTPTLRGLGSTAPYLHTGEARSLKEVVRFYREASELARRGELRNAPPEYFGMRLQETDVAPLVAFMKTLDDAAPP